MRHPIIGDTNHKIRIGIATNNSGEFEKIKTNKQNVANAGPTHIFLNIIAILLLDCAEAAAAEGVHSSNFLQLISILHVVLIIASENR